MIWRIGIVIRSIQSLIVRLIIKRVTAVVVLIAGLTLPLPLVSMTEWNGVGVVLSLSLVLQMVTTTQHVWGIVHM